MGDQISCCDAKTQLDNADQFKEFNGKPPAKPGLSDESIKKMKELRFPQMSNDISSIIRIAQQSKYFEPRPSTFSARKQIIRYGFNEQPLAVYEGSLTNGHPDGFGCVAFDNGSFFEGHFREGQPTNGIFVLSKNCYFVGDIVNFQASGSGVLDHFQQGYYYEGQWKKNLQHGHGVQKHSNHDQYVGEFFCGSKFGEGEYTFADKRVYKGSFYNGHSDGFGKLVLPNGDSYEGEWKLGQMHGKGVYKWKNGEKYEGQYVHGARENRGKYTFLSGAYYDGEWINGLQEGEGKIVQGFDEVFGIWEKGQKID